MGADELAPRTGLLLDVNGVVQVRDEPLGPSAGPQSSEAIPALIARAEEPCHIYTEILNGCIDTVAVIGAGLYLLDEDCGYQSLRHATELFIPPDAEQLDGVTQTFGSYSYFSAPICNGGTTVGALVLLSAAPLSAQQRGTVATLAFYAATVFEREQVNRTVQRLLDRLHVMNQLNSLIASNPPLAALSKSVTRECAFQFAADVAITLTLTPDQTALEVLRGGSYGCEPGAIPTRIPLSSGVLAQVLHLGGHLSIQNFKTYANHGLHFIEALGIIAVDVHCLEVRGESLGVILVGFRRSQGLNREELIAFQELCQAAALAIANAHNQERINTYTERLQELVEQRTKELEHQTALAEQANQAKSQFLANMSHELRTPLTAIIGYSSVIRDGIFGPLTGRQSEALAAVIKSSEHLKHLIDDVLNLARVESGKEDPDPRPVSISELLQQSYKLMVQSAMSKGLTLQQPELSEECAAMKVFADPKHLQQILINLLSNAVKYTPRGGKVWIRTEVHIDKLKVSVHDTGVGIPPHKQATLFERFERGDDTYSKTQEGTGIGLNLTKRLIELNGGRIGAESVQGEGSQFWIMVPLASGESQAELALSDESSAQPVELSGLTTVVVDDNPDACAVLQQILTHAGAAVRIAHSVKDGLNLIAESPPDIILTDLAMPRESGLVLIERIRAAGSDLAGTPILVLSACAFPSDRDAAVRAGASGFVAKPFRPREVLKSVRDLTFARALGGQISF